MTVKSAHAELDTLDQANNSKKGCSRLKQEPKSLIKALEQLDSSIAKIFESQEYKKCKIFLGNMSKGVPSLTLVFKRGSTIILVYKEGFHSSCVLFTPFLTKFSDENWGSNPRNPIHYGSASGL
jgi:hypothetical protein